MLKQAETLCYTIAARMCRVLDLFTSSSALSLSITPVVDCPTGITATQLCARESFKIVFFILLKESNGPACKSA